MVDLYLENISYAVVDGITKRHIIRQSSLSVAQGEKVLIKGASGAGKTTLLNMICGFLKPDEGRLHWKGQCLSTLSKRTQERFRSEHMGIVFQQPYFLDELTVYENMILPLRILQKGTFEEHVNVLAEQMGLDVAILNRYPFQLSGGERTRANLVRSVVHQPSIVIADEPAAALDTKMSETIYQYMTNSLAFKDKTLLVVSHDVNITQYFDTVYQLTNGSLEKQDV